MEKQDVTLAAVATEIMPVTRRIPHEEKLQLREEVTGLLIAEKKGKAAVAEVQAAFKEENKPRRERINELLSVLDVGSRRENVTCHLVPDYDKDEMQYITIEGEIVFTRRLKPEERQINIFPMTGTDQPNK